jgi:hypothetical protein
MDIPLQGIGTNFETKSEISGSISKKKLGVKGISSDFHFIRRAYQ